MEVYRIPVNYKLNKEFGIVGLNGGASGFCGEVSCEEEKSENQVQGANREHGKREPSRGWLV
jgi:hypothetical protein